MARHKDVDWNFANPLPTLEHAVLAALMDVRDELKAINRTLSCANFVGIPVTLRAIRRNTTRPRPSKRKK